MVLLVLVMCVAAFAGCSQNSGAGTQGADSGAAASTDYLSWSGKDWDGASDADKLEAAKALTIKIDSSGTLKDNEEALNATAEQLVPMLDSLFAVDASVTINDLASQVEELGIL